MRESNSKDHRESLNASFILAGQVEMRTAERRSKENIKAMETRHNLEMSRVKQVFIEILSTLIR